MKLTSSQEEQLRGHWPITGEIRFHRRVANFVYFATLENQPVVVRLTEPHYRHRPEIESELDWVKFLRDRGLKVAHPIPSRDGGLVETVDNFHAAVFHFAPGERLMSAQVDAPILQKWGEFLGKMHRLSQEYIPSPGIGKRPEWQNDANLLLARQSLDEKEPVVFTRYHELTGWLALLPQDRRAYGLIHCDLHSGNFHVDRGELTVFDFDDSHYHWFCFDLIPCFNDAERMASEKFPEWPAHQAREIFLEGYLRENSLDPVWIQRLPLFEKYRAVFRYLWVKTGLKNQIFDEKGIAWAQQAMPSALEIFRGPLELF